MTVTELNRAGQVIVTDDDSIIIQNLLETIPGGVTLDVSDFQENVITAGYPIAKEDDTYKPTLTAGDASKIVGYVVASVPKSKPLASVMVRGTLNTIAFKNATGKDIPDEFQNVKLINYIK